MGAVRIQTGATEPIRAFIVGNGNPPPPITGLTDIAARIWRISSGAIEYFDWSDNTFKPFGSVTTLNRVLVEVDLISGGGGSSGEYILNTTPHLGGFNTSAIANTNANDTYYITVTQLVGTQAKNVPQIGEITEGQFVDRIDENISAVKTDTTELLARLTLARAAALDKIDGVDTATLLTRKILTNQLRMSSGDTDNWELLDDNNTTVLLRWSVTDVNGDAILLRPQVVPARRTQAVTP